MSSPENEPASRFYALRLTPRARADIQAAHSYLAETAGEEIAEEWEAGLLDAVATLATAPRRLVTAPESARFRQEVRQLLYRRRAGAVTYRVLFTIVEATQDAPSVRVLHIRHSAARPVTRAEARAMETEV